MATSFPYASGGSLAKAIAQFRQSFPPVINASTLKKFSIAPNNESYVISVLRFLGLIDEEGNRRDENIAYFYGSDDDFKTGFEAALRQSYKPLFDDFGDGALEKSRDELVPWFRATDKSSQIVGGRQAGTFTALAGIAGHGEAPAIPSSTGGGNGTATKPKPKPAAKASTKPTQKVAESTASAVTPEPKAPVTVGGGADVGLTVRIEVNLPAGGDESTYDAIFKSIRKNLIDGRS